MPHARMQPPMRSRKDSDAAASAAQARTGYTRLCAADASGRHCPARSTCADAFGVRSSPLGADMVVKSGNMSADMLIMQGLLALCWP